MGSTVIVAVDYGTAASVAARLGLGLDWHYPHDIEHVLGLAITRLVWVEGWEGSRQMTAEAVAAVVARMTSNATEELIGRRANFDPAVSSPFMDAVTSEPPRNIQHARRRRQPLVAKAWWWVYLPIGMCLGAGVSLMGDSLGWW